MINLNEIEILDSKKKFIPITHDKVFKVIFKGRLDFLKTFIISQLELDISPNECKIELLDSEIPKMYYQEYQKTVDIYVKINDIYVNIEVNRSKFKDIKNRNLMYADRLYSMILNQSENINAINNQIFFQININATDNKDLNNKEIKYGTDELVMYGKTSKITYNYNKVILIKYLAYYRDLYYNKGEKLNKTDLWMVLLASETLGELYNVSKQLFCEEEHYNFIRKVINIMTNRKYFEEWELKKLNELIDFNEKTNAFNEGLEQGIEQGIKKNTHNTIINMLKNNLDISLISKISEKSIEEITQIKNENNL